jgi:hypothetical protein
MIMWAVKKIEVRPGHRLWVEFADGVRGEVDLTGDLFGPLGQPLLDEQRFAEAFIDEFGAVAWPNGFDLGPDWLHEQLGGGRYPDRSPPAGWDAREGSDGDD